ncbi:MAG: hypothetical protein GY851_35450 [bacterium]|nr:hypothetical protein [bacterium]
MKVRLNNQLIARLKVRAALCRTLTSKLIRRAMRRKWSGSVNRESPLMHSPRAAASFEIEPGRGMQTPADVRAALIEALDATETEATPLELEPCRSYQVLEENNGW